MPVFNWILSVTFIRSLVVGLLPGLVLKIFIVLLPPLLRALNMHAGWVSNSEVDFSVVEMLFLFQVWLVFFTTFVAGETRASGAESRTFLLSWTDCMRTSHM